MYLDLIENWVVTRVHIIYIYKDYKYIDAVWFWMPFKAHVKMFSTTITSKLMYFVAVRSNAYFSERLLRKYIFFYNNEFCKLVN